jgi:D-glycero-alpha-D-manno-heptose-7-phosphate kinase
MQRKTRGVTVIRSRAPLRLGLARGGTDVSSFSDIYGGAILNAAIDCYAYATIELLDTGMIEFISADFNDQVVTAPCRC